MTHKIFKTKPNYETQGEWFDRLASNAGKALCLLGIVLAVVAAVAHLASAMYLNLLLDAAVMAGAVIGLTHKENKD